MPEVLASSTTAVPRGASAEGGSSSHHRHRDGFGDRGLERVQRALAAIGHGPQQQLVLRAGDRPSVGDRVRRGCRADRPLERVEGDDDPVGGGNAHERVHALRGSST
jgi:hypothetical protein